MPDKKKKNAIRAQHLRDKRHISTGQLRYSKSISFHIENKHLKYVNIHTQAICGILGATQFED